MDTTIIEVEEQEEYQDTVFSQLDFQTEILNSDKRLFMLIAGVGAGKNYWVKTLTEKGHEDKGYSPDGYKVLLITSRTSTVNAQCIKLDADKRFHFADLHQYGDWWGDEPPTQKVVCCTNSYIEWYAKNLYDPDDPKTHVWNMFDFIILDEAHSMTCDATFSEAPFHVQAFLRHAYREGQRCRIVMMSGTPEPISWLYEGVVNQKDVKTINLYKRCRHLEPTQVWLRPRLGLVEKIVSKLRNGKRVIYFATTSNNMQALIEDLKANGVPLEDIGIAYSDDPEKDKKFDLELVEKRACIQDALSNDEVLPADIKIFITTSKNKEGININDPDIKDMIVESHQRDEVRQMAGRVREGLNHLVIVSDAAQHFSNGSPLFAKIDRKCVRSINAAAQEYWTHKDGRLSVKEKEKNISKIEERYRYVRYDCFREEFRFYTGRFKGDALADLSERSFKQAVESCKDASYTGDYSGYDDLAAWFPDARTAIDPQSTLKEAVSKLLVDREILGKEISKEERDELAEGIRRLVRSCEQTDTNIKANFVSLAPVLKKLGYKQNETPGKRKGSSFVITEE